MHRNVPSGVDISAEYMFDENLLQDSPMSAFFRSKTVFVTGSTGYLGQLLVERLLRYLHTCTHIRSAIVHTPNSKN